MSHLLIFLSKKMVSLSLDDRFSLTLAGDTILELTSGLGEKSGKMS